MLRRLVVFVLWSLVVLYLSFSVIVIINSFRPDRPNPYRRFRPEDQLLQIERDQPPPTLHYNRL